MDAASETVGRTVTGMKDDVISRVAAANIVRFECGEWRGLAKTIIDEFEALPTVDAVPVVHGRWVADPEDDGVCSCSECGRYEFYQSEFCPNCGADMRKDGGNG